MSALPRIAAVKTLTLHAPLPVPVVFGNWVMRHREFAVCGVLATDGTVGVSFCYTRDGPIREIVQRLIAPAYVDGDPTDPEGLFDAARWSNNAILSAGAGHRALSLVDVAAWDLAAKTRGLPIEEHLGGAQRRQLATAIVGFAHMFPHVHSRWLSALGIEGAPIESGIAGNGLDQLSDSFSRPTVSDGWMDPLPADRGFGMVVDPDWLRAQTHDDPDGLIGDL